MNYAEESLKLHEKWKGKIEVIATVPVATKDDLSLAYTPGVAQPCLEIQKDVNRSYDLTRRHNLCAVITDGSAVLGLGDIGPEAGMPVMEGKCVLFKAFGGVDAFPLCVKTKNVDEFVNAVALISGSFGGINLEDIAAPRCFEIERKLKERCDIPIFHDDQHGTAVITLAGPAVYAALALKGFFPYEDILTLNQPGTSFPSHCDKNKTPGVDMTTGSLGQGTSLAVGMAVGDGIKGRPSRTYLIVGDGESNEGQVWEAAMFAAGKKVKNLFWLIDENKKQLDGTTDSVLPLFDLREKFEAFGFEALRVDGNDVEAVYNALTAPVGDRPRAIVLDTVKGRGIPEVEQMASNHSVTTDAETYDKWLAVLRAHLAELEERRS